MKKELPVIITTHNRTRVAVKCIESLIKNLKYDGEIKYIVSDDMSEIKHIEKIMNVFIHNKIDNFTVLETDRHSSYGLGASLNNGLNEAFKTSDFVLTTEDDWYLQKEFNITNYCKLIDKDENVFGIRLARLLRNTVEEDKDIIYKNERFLTIKDYAFNNQVMLRHRRCYNKLGYYPVNVNTDVVENTLRDRYNNLIRSENIYNNRILWPSKLPQNTSDDPNLYFIHIGKSTVNHHYFSVPKRFMYLYTNE